MKLWVVFSKQKCQKPLFIIICNFVQFLILETKIEQGDNFIQYTYLETFHSSITKIDLLTENDFIQFLIALSICLLFFGKDYQCHINRRMWIVCFSLTRCKKSVCLGVNCSSVIAYFPVYRGSTQTKDCFNDFLQYHAHG